MEILDYMKILDMVLTVNGLLMLLFSVRKLFFFHYFSASEGMSERCSYFAILQCRRACQKDVLISLFFSVGVHARKLFLICYSSVSEYMPERCSYFAIFQRRRTRRKAFHSLDDGLYHNSFFTYKQFPLKWKCSCYFGVIISRGLGIYIYPLLILSFHFAFLKEIAGECFSIRFTKMSNPRNVK